VSQKKPKVLCAMSGGVDSSVAAALLIELGYEVVGCFMRLGSPGESIDEMVPAEDAAACRPLKIGHQGCCSINDAADARLVAAQLGIAFYVCNFKKDFGRIIDYFVAEYASGRTPNPCVRCNDWLKFGKLHEYAKQIDADFVASGHYAQVESAGGPPRGRGARMLRGLDEDKDQSYVLFGVPRAQLGQMLLPVGGMRKSEVRELAKKLKLPVFNKPDSQEICFVPDNDYAGLVERKRPELAREGAIVDESGREVGRHGGQHKFTLGQRRRVGVALGYPIYVVGKDAQTNTITVGSAEGLKSTRCTVAEPNWLVDASRFAEWTDVLVKYRYNSDAVAARVRVLSGEGSAPNYSGRAGRFELEFAAAQTAVTPGQAAVVYDAREPAWVLGGGWIAAVQK